EYFRLVRENADVFAAQPLAVHRGALEAYVSGASYRGLTTEQLAMLTRPWTTPQGQDAFYRQIAQADERFTAEVEQSYADIDIPVAVIWGREDGWIPVDRAYRLAEIIPGCELKIVPEAGHLIQLDQPVALATTLHSWLARRSESAPSEGAT
ncbi:MAG: alpha/beta hydrolase, partial [Nocardioidaceae bacterium]